MDNLTLLDHVDLRDKARAKPPNLSGGQQQCFSIVCARVNTPRVLFLDEPTTGLDPQAKRNLWRLVRRLNAEGMTIMLTTSRIATELVDTLSANSLFNVTVGSEDELKTALLDGHGSLVLVVPAAFDDVATGVELQVFVDSTQVRLLQLILPTMENVLLAIERTFRNEEPLFHLTVEDVKARSQRYLDFLLLGILAFSLMQISIAGSGFNVVEYRRKGILKRLLVTPIRPFDFIAAICVARLGWCLLQLTALMAVAVFLLDVAIPGSPLALYLIIVLCTIIFLCIGFCIGSLAKTQQAAGAIGNIVIFPQIFLSGVFFPISAMPLFFQPVAHSLPLSFVVNGLRGIANDGASLQDIAPDLAGVFVWIVISFLVATRLFLCKEVVR